MKEGKPLSTLKHVCWENANKVSQKQWMLELSNLCHCVQYPRKLTSRRFWSSRKEGKPLYQQKHVFIKWCGVSQKQWMLELSNLCHCVQHPRQLTNRHFWSSRNERKLLCNQKCVLTKYCEVSQTQWMLEDFEKMMLGICKQKWVLRKWCWVSQTQWMLDLSNLCHCVQHPGKLTSMHFWCSRKERKPLYQQKCVFIKCCGVLKNSEC